MCRRGKGRGGGRGLVRARFSCGGCCAYSRRRLAFHRRWGRSSRRFWSSEGNGARLKNLQRPGTHGAHAAGRGTGQHQKMQHKHQCNKGKQGTAWNHGQATLPLPAQRMPLPRLPSPRCSRPLAPQVASTCQPFYETCYPPRWVARRPAGGRLARPRQRPLRHRHRQPPSAGAGRLGVSLPPVAGPLRRAKRRPCPPRLPL